MEMEQIIERCLADADFKSAFSSFVGDAKSALVVHGHRSYLTCGAMDLMEELMRSMSIADFDDFTENPKMEDVQKGVSLLQRATPDIVVAVGGGSVMDMAKLIRYYAHRDIRLLAIPTTAGTGAESTQFAVCYIDGVKHSISDASILPNSVILYPPFTYNNSRYLTSCTGFDALAQAIEAYWNINATVESDDYALEAIGMIYPLLVKEQLTPSDRAALLRGANAAGRAINMTRTTVPHALSYTLTSKYGYPHGHAVALTFPFFLRYNLEGDADRFMGRDYDNYAEKMERLRSMLNLQDSPFAVMKHYLSRLGLGFDQSRDFDDMTVARGINLERARNTPIAIEPDVILAAVKSIRE